MKEASFFSVLVWALFFLFLTLKLTETIDWSWWWVTAPLRGGLAAGFSFLAIATVVLTLRQIMRREERR